MPKDPATYCVNVDIGQRNDPKGDPCCEKPGHVGKGPHFDITIHMTSCPVVGRTGKSCETQRHWEHCPPPRGVDRHFSTLSGAEQWALVQRDHCKSASCWVGVRHCRVCLPQSLDALPAD